MGEVGINNSYQRKRHLQYNVLSSNLTDTFGCISRMNARSIAWGHLKTVIIARCLNVDVRTLTTCIRHYAYAVDAGLGLRSSSMTVGDVDCYH